MGRKSNANPKFKCEDKNDNKDWHDKDYNLRMTWIGKYCTKQEGIDP